MVDPVSLELVAGSEIDYVEDLGGASFKVTNPNAALRDRSSWASSEARKGIASNIVMLIIFCSMNVVAGHSRCAVGAADIRIELGEHPFGVVAVQPDMAIVVGRKHAPLVDRRRRIVFHRSYSTP